MAALAVLAGVGLLAGASARGQEAPWAAENPEPAAVEGVPAAAAPADPAPAPGPFRAGRSAPVEARTPAADALERAWREPAASLEERVSRTRRTALEHGIWSLDAAARAALAGDVAGDPIERARAAVRVAPDLPAGRMELARATWLHGNESLSALRTAFTALLAIPRHAEASLWFGAWALCVLAVALVAAGLLTIAAAAALAAPHAAHDLGDLVSRHTPDYARAALLASALLVPLACGEGPLGVLLALLLLGFVYGSGRQRGVLVIAAAALVGGAYPVARLAGSALLLFHSDPVADAALSVSQGEALAADVARLEAAEGDLLAARALALHARRTGNLGTADAHYQALLARDPGDPALANNAANVRLRLGHIESALALYRSALAQGDSPVVLYNLSQAFGRAFQVDALTDTLAEAQRLDDALVAEFTGLQGAEPQGFVVDLPLPQELFWRRVLASDAGELLAAAARGPLAPGALGADLRSAALACAWVVLVGLLLGWRVPRSRQCPRCGARLCRRCDPDVSPGELCEGCHRLFNRPEETDRALRMARVTALARREQRVGRAAAAVSLLVPGAAGMIAGRPLRSLLSAFLFAVAGCALLWRHGIVPDPLVAGAAAPLVFVGIAAVSGAAYASLVAASLAARRRT